MISHEKPPAPPGLDIGLAGSIQRGPDGKPWPVLHFNTPFAQFALFMPIDAAERLANALPGMLQSLAQDARRQETGLVVVDQANISHLLQGKHEK